MDQTADRNFDAKLDASVAKMNTLAEQISETLAKLNATLGQFHQSSARIERALAERNTTFGGPFWLLMLLIGVAVFIYLSPNLGLKRYVDHGSEKIGQVGSQVADKIARNSAEHRVQKAGTGQGSAGTVAAKQAPAPLSSAKAAAPAASHPVAGVPAVAAKLTPPAPAKAPATTAVAANQALPTTTPPAASPAIAPATAPELAPNTVAAARVAARDYQYGLAIRLYETYLDANPGDADAWGELGNVQMAVGRPYEAAQNYYQSSIRQLGRNRAPTIYPLLPIITRYQPALAIALRQRMTVSGI